MAAKHQVRDRIHRGYGWIRGLSRQELVVMLCLVVVSGGLWLFVELADEVTEGETHSIDEQLLLALRTPADHSDPLGPGWVEEMGRDFTALGSVGVLTLMILGTLGYLLLSRHYRTTLFTLVVASGGVLLTVFLKSGFNRPRPDLVPHGMEVYSASFPSGHAMMSAIAYLTLAAILTQVVTRWRLKVYLLSVAVFLTVLVGISRVYLGVHWPSDVIAGWAVGGVWASGCLLVAYWMQRRGVMRPTRD